MVFGRFQKLLSSRPAEVSDEDDIEEAEEQGSPRTKSHHSEDEIHKDFRLWITARSDEGRLIPGELPAL